MTNLPETFCPECRAHRRHILDGRCLCCGIARPTDPNAAPLSPGEHAPGDGYTRDARGLPVLAGA